MKNVGRTPIEQRLRLALRHHRSRLGWTQERMARALGVEPSTYATYETRSTIPHELIPRFCAITGILETDLYRFDPNQKA